MPKPDLTDLSWGRFDALVDTDPLALRDLAFALAGELTDLRTRAEALADEYDRKSRPVLSGTIARMLREWVGA